MKSTRTLAIVTAASLSLALAGCGGSTGNSGANNSASGSSGGGQCGSSGAFCIGLVTDVGKVDDKSFNQSAWEGVEAAAKSLGAQTKYIETTDTKDYAKNIKQFTDAKYNVVVTVGFLLDKATKAAAQANPNIKFIGVDQDQGTTKIANYAGLVFPEDQAGYAAGYLSGLLTKKNKLGQTLGLKVPAVEKFALGYVAGAKKANPKVSVSTVYHPAGDNAFADPVWGANTAKQQLAQGADIVFGAGGKTGNGALGQVAKTAGAGTSLYCIGVDSDQWNTVPEARKCLVTSAMKLISKGTNELITQAKDNKMAGGNYVGDVGLAPFHDFDSKLPADVKTKVAAVVKGLQAGTIKTGVTVK